MRGKENRGRAAADRGGKLFGVSFVWTSSCEKRLKEEAKKKEKKPAADDLWPNWSDPEQVHRWVQIREAGSAAAVGQWQKNSHENVIRLLNSTSEQLLTVHPTFRWNQGELTLTWPHRGPFLWNATLWKWQIQSKDIFKHAWFLHFSFPLVTFHFFEWIIT